ncbi:MAG: sel1 repeat family protein [Parasporobacterium sp.]|nr:sel1 repeat family protein [Parasporobacterium sp.]
MSYLPTQRMEQSENAKNYEKANKLFSVDGIPENRRKAIELFLETAVNGYVPAMDEMARICHNDLDGMKTQDRAQEYFWFEQMLKGLNGKRLLYHAQNMMEGSYDRFFSEHEINRVLALSAALGNDEAKEYLAFYYANKKDDTESLKKSLYWFYSMEEKNERALKRLEEVEKMLREKMC